LRHPLIWLSAIARGRNRKLLISTVCFLLLCIALAATFRWSTVDPDDVAADKPAVSHEAAAENGGVVQPAQPSRSKNPIRFPVFDGPANVAPEQTFELVFWLSLDPLTPEVLTEAERTRELARPAEDGGVEFRLPQQNGGWTFTARLMAPGFDIVSGKKVQDIFVPAGADMDPVLFTLRAKTGDPAATERRIQMTLWHDGAFIARFTKAITVAKATSTLMMVADQPVAEKQSQKNSGVTLNLRRVEPDLTVYLLYDDPGKLGSGDIIVASPHLAQAAADGSFSTPPDSAEWLNQKLSTVTALGRKARGIEVIETDTGYRTESEATLRGLGCEIYARMAPQQFKQVFKLLSKRPDLESIQIYTNNPLIPWEIMVPSDNCADASTTFLGVRYRIGRLLSDSNRPADEASSSILPIKQISTIAPSYGSGTALAFQDRELRFLSAYKGYNRLKGSKAAVLQSMQSGVNGILHFAGHGSAARSEGGIPLYLVELEDGSLDPDTWKGAAGASASNMIIFFNACDVGQADFGVGSLMGWAPASLSAGARGFIGGLWPVFDRAAADATERFYSSLLKEPQVYVTAALRNVRARYAETGDPSYLAYAFYGDVNLMTERQD
jgi:hypothetical protein